MVRDIWLIAIGWAIPTFGTWLLEWIPSTKEWLDEHLVARVLLYSFVISTLSALLIVIAYDRLYLPKNIIAFVQENESCPTNYSDNGLIVVGHLKSSSHFYLSPELRNNAGLFQEQGVWPLDHIRICSKD